MNVKEAYDLWADQYDSNHNRTRDMEAVALRETLQNLEVKTCLEIGCGTGKNTEWLISKAENILAVDLSEKMIEKAKSKIHSHGVEFVQADITKEWHFTEERKFDLVTFSLVLEHISDLGRIFHRLKSVVAEKGYIYIGELHPLKQYTGTKARFETEKGLQVVTCFNHHISDFTISAKKNGFKVLDINEYSDNDDRDLVPRILTLLFQKETR